MFEEFNHFFRENTEDRRVNDKGELVPDKCDKCGSKIAIFLHGEPIYQCTNKKCKKYFGTVPCNINESYMTYEWLMKQSFPDKDSTSGTSEQESTIPRSNEVYTNGGSIEKINDFPFDKVYFGSPNKMPNTMKLDGPLFVTPYAGVASIFAVRPQDLRKYGVTRGMRINRDYDEWKLPLTQLKEPFSTIHVVLQGLDKPFTMKPVVENATGYIYEIEVTPEIKEHIYQSSKMDTEKEFCIDGIDNIDFSNMKKIDVKVCIRGDNDTVQEAYDAVTGKEIPIDHAYTMDEMKERTYTDDDLDKIQSKEELNAFYTELKSKLGQDETIQESKMPAKKRNSLDNKDFGLVYKDENGKTIRKYPLNDKAHVASAARLFGHCPDKYKKRLANKILRKAHEFGMDTSGWDTVNKAAKG